MAKAQAKGDKEYENALRQHTKNQSKQTEKMMKKSKKSLLLSNTLSLRN